MRVENTYVLSGPARQSRGLNSAKSTFSDILERSSASVFTQVGGVSSQEDSSGAGATSPHSATRPPHNPGTTEQLVSVPQHAPPGSTIPEGYCEALYSLINQPDLTTQERNQIAFASLFSMALSQAGSANKMATPAGGGNNDPAEFDSVKSLLATINALAIQDPNIGQIGRAWAATYAATTTLTAGTE